MKTIAAVDLKNGSKSVDFHERFLEEDFQIIYIETGGDMDSAAEALEKWDARVDVLAIENLRLPFRTGPEALGNPKKQKINELAGFFNTPLATGGKTHAVSRKWTLDQIGKSVGDDLFGDAKILFTSGMTDADIARNLLEYTDRLFFCDPVLSGGIPKILHSMEDLRLYAEYIHPVSEKVQAKKWAQMTYFLDACNSHLVSAGIKEADIVVVPHDRFFDDIGHFGIDELNGKIVITAAVSAEKRNFLKKRGVRMIIDTIPKMTQNIVGPGVLEAMILASSAKNHLSLADRHIENAINRADAEPRIIFPFGNKTGGTLAQDSAGHTGR
jgi:hypothetical protein